MTEKSANEKVLDRLGEGSANGTELAKAIGLSDTTVRRALKELAAAGVVKRDGSVWAVVTATEPAVPEPKKAKAVSGGASQTSRAAAQARDELVFDTIKSMPDGGTRDEVANLAGTGGLTYMSIWRLHKAHRVVKSHSGGRAPTWKVASVPVAATS